MRKPWVVICAAASALLVGTGVVATTAGASENPDVPGFSGFMPDFLGWPQFGGGDDSGDVANDDGAGDFADDSGDSDVQDYDNDDAAGDGTVTNDGDAAKDADKSDMRGQRSDALATPDRADRDRAGAQAHPGTQAHIGAQGQAAAPGQAAAQGDTDARDQAQTRDQAAQRPARTQQNLAFAQNQASASLLATARQSVTRADVSANPNSRAQQQILALVNQNRRRGGCGSLSLDRRLIEAANEHAADMARRDYFAHESPNGDGSGDRMREAGYRWQRYGENIARGVDSPWEVVDGWMHSPAHRENILDCRLHQMGIGLAIAGDRTIYWVQDFATPM
jgi:uncharacterized protein YkwD